MSAKESFRVKWAIEGNGVGFKVLHADQPLAWTLPMGSAEHDQLLTADEISFQQLSALNQVHLTGLLHDREPGSWWLSAQDLYTLDDTCREDLGFPATDNVSSQLLTEFVPSIRADRLKISVGHSKYGELTRYPRASGLFQCGAEFVMVPEDVAKLLEHADAYPRRVETEPEKEAYIRYLAQGKELGTISGSSIEGSLAREDYQFVDRIGVDIEEESPQKLVLKPRAENISADATQELIRRMGGERSVINQPTRQGVKRVILSEEQRDTLANSFQGGSREITGADVPHFIEEPQAFLPEGLDLALFSERVKGLKLRVYNSRPYVHFRKEPLNWFEGVEMGAELDTGESDPATIPEDSTPRYSADRYGKMAKESLGSGKPYVFDEDSGSWVHVDPQEAEEFLEAQRRIELLHDNPPTEGLEKYILEIFENLNTLDFTLHDGIQDVPEHYIQDEPSWDLFPPPGIFAGEFRPFQRIGYSWLRALDSKSKGGLLADDMGLGKTVQAIGLLAARKEAGTLKPSLAVLPKTLIENWDEELTNFCPRLRWHVLTGPCPGIGFFEHIDLTLITYDYLRRNQIELAKVDWKVVICDEAQYVKNPTTGRTTALKALKTEMRLALTGTPVENGLSELWCILDFVQPGLLGSLSSFRKSYENPIVQAENETGRTKASRVLIEAIKGNYLRRMKSVLGDELPQKLEEVTHVSLSPYQENQYSRIVSEGRKGGRGAMLSALQKLFLLCSCPWPESELPNLSQERAVSECPKMGQLFDVLDAVAAKKEKVLIFLNRKRVQYLLQRLVWHRYQIRADVLNGDMNSGRQAAVKAFNQSSGFNVMILSPEVGGTGLNITSANHVIHYMRVWNPAKENQATDRTYRIGQEKDVTVYYIVNKGNGYATVDEVLDELLKSKLALAEDVLVPSSSIVVSERELMQKVFEGN